MLPSSQKSCGFYAERTVSMCNPPSLDNIHCAFCNRKLHQTPKNQTSDQRKEEDNATV